MTDTETLLALLRHEYSVTNQQFTHILALRVWGESDVAERIVEVDNVDFANGMAIVDHLVQNRTPVILTPDTFLPGTGRQSALQREQAIEAQISAFLDAANCAEETANGFLETARGPRAAYAGWLATHLEDPLEPLSETANPYEETLGLVAHLISLMEQSSIHAYIHRHHGSTADADAAWMTSGKAMMHLTAIVHHFAVQGSLPRPGLCPQPIIGIDPASAIDADRQMASTCAREAKAAAEACSQEKLVKLCGKIAIYCEGLAQWRPGQEHPATGNIPAVFTSFEATLARMAT